MQNVPDIAIIIDQKREMTAIRECRKLGNSSDFDFRYKL
jgi:ribosomal protein S2